VEFCLACCPGNSSSKPIACGYCRFLHKGTCHFTISKRVLSSQYSDPFCVVQFSVFIGAPIVGKLMDHFPRIPMYTVLNAVQVPVFIFFSFLNYGSSLLNYHKISCY
jgi:hypothetical protein